MSTNCTVKGCPEMPGDLTTYNLQDAIYFNGTPLSFLVNCPAGYYCPPGSFPRTFTYPPGTFVFPKPPGGAGNPLVFSMRGCSSTVTIVLPAGSSAAAQNAAAQQVISQVAAQQAQCDAITSLPPGSKIPNLITLTDIELYACVDVPFSATVTASATPSGAPYTIFTVFPPAWMADNQSGSSLALTGTPTAVGPVTFSVEAFGTLSYGSRTYTLNIVEIATASPLPDATEAALYGEVLDASSIPGTLTWSVVGGWLPVWLNLNSVTGSLSGTPGPGDVGLTSNFTIQASNGTVACSKNFDVEVAADACAWFQGLLWSPAAPSVIGSGSASGLGLANVITADVQADNPGDYAEVDVNSLLLANPGPPLACTINLNVATGTGYTVIQVFSFSSVSGLLDLYQIISPAVGNYSNPINIPTSAPGETFAINIVVSCGDLFSAGGHMICTITLGT